MRHLIAAVLLVGTVSAGSPGTPAGADPVTCTGMGGTIVSSSICHVRTANPSYTVDMTFPVDYPDGQALMGYLSQNRDGFVSVAQTSQAHDQPYQMVVTTQQYQSGQLPHGTRSVVLKLFQDFGSTSPFSWYRAFNYSFDRKKPLAFGTLFAPGANPLDSIYPIVQQELEHHTMSAGTVSSSAGLDPSHYQNFAITDDELIFYFAQGELLPPFLGPAHAGVPRTAIPALAL